MSIKTYYRLAKPGIVYGNMITALAGFLFASKWQFNILTLMATIVGLGLVIGSACVFNNFVDRDIDAKMERTKNRGFAAHSISPAAGLTYGAALGIIGIALLIMYVNLLTAAITFFGFLVYVILYGYTKRVSHWGTVVGSISGSVPIVVGYTAVVNRLDIEALLLFIILAVWQMPHFYAIAIYRMEDYKSAGIPVLPIKKGNGVTKIYTLCYIVAFLIAASLLTFLGYAGYTYLAIELVLGFAWLWLAIEGLWTKDDVAWARKIFFFSLIVIIGYSIALSIASILP